eukprot:tig00020603_g11826.t1
MGAKSHGDAAALLQLGSSMAVRMRGTRSAPSALEGSASALRATNVEDLMATGSLRPARFGRRMTADYCPGRLGGVARWRSSTPDPDPADPTAGFPGVELVEINFNGNRLGELRRLIVVPLPGGPVRFGADGAGRPHRESFEAEGGSEPRRLRASHAHTGTAPVLPRGPPRGTVVLREIRKYQKTYALSPCALWPPGQGAGPGRGDRGAAIEEARPALAEGGDRVEGLIQTLEGANLCAVHLTKTLEGA